MGQTIEQQILARAYGHGRGWAFSSKDFLHLGSRKAVDVALIRLTNAGTIRRVIRGIYDYPRFSDFLNQQLGPDIHQVSLALARKFGWSIQAGSAAALNLIGLSTQVPSQFIYYSNDPDRKYVIDKTALQFEKTTLKDSNGRNGDRCAGHKGTGSKADNERRAENDSGMVRPKQIIKGA
ncbi:MAG TPA: DUF6088 family protein [Pyrinomonadaceae bacterium]|nr:DUF6088 family protein [Pyrinomonadaceae bacterium]HMP64096.1 DUF6088 family protein [Pyrinomonadaceae bacterium]